MDAQPDKIDYSEIIAENFGANATYVEGLLSRFRSDPNLVDESWRAYFAEMLGASQASAVSGENGNAPRTTTAATTGQTTGGNGAGAQATAAAATAAPTSTAPTEVSNVQAVTAAAPPPPAAPQAATAATAPSTATAQAVTTTAPAPGVESTAIRGGALKIVENMETSLTVPTATSNRQVPVKVLEENRVIINRNLKETNRGKASYTHIIAFALLRALEKFPQMNDGYVNSDGTPARLRRPEVNLGLAIDLEKKDGTRTLLVPNIKNAGALSFSQFLAAYDDIIKRARGGKLGIPDFQNTTVSLTNPGTIGTVASTPRLMAGQSVIIATGAIEYPAEYHAMAPEALSQLGISKIFTISSTYDHRI
ncbi:MAG: 2-oxo acid dehydrogenase subunit E2, partial [Pyrinomonadaceae bacterium]|nr:2-oxo acid dehydrogenase subunit E2 [Pyrinomonadaceae bacterium]